MTYLQCPECGYAQKSRAEKRVVCHRCGRSYRRRTAKRVERKRPDKELGTGFVRFQMDGDGS